MVAITRRGFLAGLACSTLPLGSAGVASAGYLRARAKRAGIIIGGAATGQQLRDAEFARIVAADLQYLTTENDLKWDYMEPARASFRLDGGRSLVNFAKANRLQVKGHPVIWHRRIPLWARDVLRNGRLKQCEALLNERVSSCFSLFRGSINEWDVVNEPVDPDGSGGLRTSLWSSRFGKDFVEISILSARAFNPKAKIIINEHTLDYDDGFTRRKRKAFLDLLNHLATKGALPDAIGIQSHLIVRGAPFNESRFRAFLNEISSFGLDILLSEIDVRDEKAPAGQTLEQRDKAIAEEAYRYLSVALTVKSVSHIVFWGLSDRYSWMNETDRYIWPARQKPRPLPYDAELVRKPLWFSVAKALDEAPSR